MSPSGVQLILLKKIAFTIFRSDRLLEMLKLRVDDDAFPVLIRQWLKAGMLDIDGEIVHRESEHNRRAGCGKTARPV